MRQHLPECNHACTGRRNGGRNRHHLISSALSLQHCFVDEALDSCCMWRSRQEMLPITHTVIVMSVRCRPTNSSAENLRVQLIAMRDSMQADDWVTQLDDLTAALIFSVGAQNPHSSE